MNTTLNFTINSNVRNIQFVGTDTMLFRAWITGEKGLGVKEIQDFNTCKGILNAFTDMVKIHRYNTHMKGLHLLPSIARLATEIVMEEVGYVNNHYVGVIPVDGMEKLDDENPLSTNWGIVSFKNGRLNVVKKITAIAGTKTESDEVKHERHAVDLMNGFEIVESNCSLSLIPLTKSRASQSTGEITSGRDVISRSLNTALQVLQASTDDDAREMVNGKVAMKQARTSFARANAMIDRLAEDGRTFNPGLVTVRVIKSLSPLVIETEPSSVLDGMFGFIFKGKNPINTFEQDFSNPATQKMIKDLNLMVMFK